MATSKQKLVKSLHSSDDCRRDPNRTPAWTSALTQGIRLQSIQPIMSTRTESHGEAPVKGNGVVHYESVAIMEMGKERQLRVSLVVFAVLLPVTGLLLVAKVLPLCCLAE